MDQDIFLMYDHLVAESNQIKKIKNFFVKEYNLLYDDPSKLSYRQIIDAIFDLKVLIYDLQEHVKTIKKLIDTAAEQDVAIVKEACAYLDATIKFENANYELLRALQNIEKCYLLGN